MLKKRLGVELMVTKLPQIEVLQRHDKTIAMACRDAGTTEPLRDECLIGEIFYGLKKHRSSLKIGASITTLNIHTLAIALAE